MIVEARVVGRPKDIEDREVPVPARTTTMRDLIGTLVRHELADFARRQRAGNLLRVLTPADLARGVDTGRYGAGVRPAQVAPTFEVANERAIEAFTDGLFFAFVDDVQIEALDEPVEIMATSRMRLVRLVALAGG